MSESPAPHGSFAARRFTLIRHGESTYNVAQRLNGDANIDVPLTEIGRSQAADLSRQLAAVDFDASGHSGFPRTRETLAIILADRSLPPPRVYPDLGDLRVGIFEGAGIEDYRSWRGEHRPDQAPPGGESRFDALARYVAGFTQLLAAPGRESLLTAHDVPIRFVANAAAGDDPLDGRVTRIRNAEVRVLTEAELRRALDVMRERLRES
jgi:broad specificity phosphatase PhoE